nr:GNAT family N-acetyltransferase [Amylibacter sp.]
MIITTGRADQYTPEIAELIWAEDPALLACEFGTLPPFDAILRQEWASKGAANSHDAMLLAWDDTGVAGLMTGYPVDQMEARFEATWHLRRDQIARKDWQDWEARSALIERLFPPPQAGDFYVLDLSIAPRSQGTGLGRRLIGIALENARAAGCKRLCLDVNADNDAVGFYRRIGLDIQIESRAPLLDERYGVGLHYHMVMPVTA